MKATDYLRELQTIEAEMGAGRLKAVVIPYETVLQRFPNIKQEVSNLITNPLRGADYDVEILRIKMLLIEIQLFVSLFENLPKGIASSQKIIDFVSQSIQSLTSQNLKDAIKSFEYLQKEVITDQKIAMENALNYEIQRELEESRKKFIAQMEVDRKKAEVQAEQSRQAAKEIQIKLDLARAELGIESAKTEQVRIVEKGKGLEELLAIKEDEAKKARIQYEDIYRKLDEKERELTKVVRILAIQNNNIENQGQEIHRLTQKMSTRIEMFLRRRYEEDPLLIWFSLFFSVASFLPLFDIFFLKGEVIITILLIFITIFILLLYNILFDLVSDPNKKS